MKQQFQSVLLILAGLALVFLGLIIISNALVTIKTNREEPGNHKLKHRLDHDPEIAKVDYVYEICGLRHGRAVHQQGCRQEIHDSTQLRKLGFVTEKRD